MAAFQHSAPSAPGPWTYVASPNRKYWDRHPMRWQDQFFIRAANGQVLAVVEEDASPRDGRAMAAAFTLIEASEAALRTLGGIDLSDLSESDRTAVAAAVDGIQAALRFIDQEGAAAA